MRCRRNRYAAVLAALLIGAAASARAAQPPAAAGQPGEFAVKAAFLYNFAKFVEWPGSILATGSPFRLCVLGTDPFGPTLDAIVRGEQLDGHALIVERLADPDGAGRCQILYVAADTRPRVRQDLFEHEDLSATLTVGEDDDLLVRGGLIRFGLDHHRVRFAVNLDATERSRLRISSKLLRLAERAHP